MFAPPLYQVRKIPAINIIRSDFDLQIKNQDFTVNQQDNMLFRQLRIVLGKTGKYIPEIVFVDCNGARSKKDEIRKLVIDGFILNGVHFVMCERSASMTRNAILSFCDEAVSKELDSHISMDLDIKQTVLSKWTAYRGLMFSSCHCLEGWFPKTIVVDDYETILKHQKLRWLVDEERTYTSYETGLEQTWKTHGIEEGYKDIEINVFDGHGLIHPRLVDDVQAMIGMEERPTSMLVRAPYIKGLLSEIDYTEYFDEHGIDFIQDIWGKWHDVHEPMIILTKSMYKGFKYFKQKGTYQDWDNYWSKFHKYNHCWGIAKWNFSREQEPIYTRGNYQILQDLDLPFEEFKQFAGKSMDWAIRVVDGDPVYTYCFLGLTGEHPKPLNNYAKAILKNPEMIHEHNTRDFLKKQTKKYIDQMKCGKIYLRACYKFLIPDIIMLLQWIGGDKNPQGSLEADEFWSIGYTGEHAIERNPHICSSEHLVLKAKETPEIEKYCGHLVNTCMLNGKSPSPQRMNGADFDGDLVLVMDEPLMLEGINKDCAIVLNLDEKMTAKEEPATKEHIADLVCRTMISLIGECSNAATCYHNKPWKSEETKKRYERNIDILSIVNSFAIDFGKTGYLMNIPYEIAKYSKPYPYFMRYISDYYEGLFKSLEKNQNGYRFQRTRKSNMNELAFMLERFHDREIKWKRNKNFNYHIMMDETIPFDQDKFDKIEQIFLSFNKEMKYLVTFEGKLHRYDEFKRELKAWDKESAMNYHVNWDSIYAKYRNECLEICEQKELANIATLICYEKYPRRSKKFLWAVASAGILENLEQKEIQIPVRDDNGCCEYLGRRYSMIDYKPDIIGN